jgi:hypothetical protein
VFCEVEFSEVFLAVSFGFFSSWSHMEFSQYQQLNINVSLVNMIGLQRSQYQQLNIKVLLAKYDIIATVTVSTAKNGIIASFIASIAKHEIIANRKV